MKKTIITAAASLCAAALCGAQGDWAFDYNSVTDPATATLSYSGVNSADTNESVYQGLKSLEKNKWFVRYSTVNSGSAELHPKNPETGETDASRLFAYSGRDSGGWSTVTAWTQHYTAFTLSEEVASAQAAKISFDVDYMGKNGDNIAIEVLPWIVREQEIELRSFSGAPDTTYKTKFLFGLVNLETGEFYDAHVSSKDDALPFGYDAASNNWAYTTDENGKVTVSFELSYDQLQTITEAGLGLVIETTNATGADYAEYYSIGDFKIEYLQIPEPASVAAVLGLAVLAFSFRSKRRK